MVIECIPVGELEVNCYLLTKNGYGILIDPGDEAEKILNRIKESGISLCAMILTHGHFDHIGAVDKIKKETNATVYIHREDADKLFDNEKNLANYFKRMVESSKADVLLEDESVIEKGPFKLKIYHTPGHSEGGICIYSDGNLFTGDLLFKNSIGRFDFGNIRVELSSLKRIMDTFEDKTPVYPGHGEKTTIGDERKNNPYIVNHIN